VLGTTVEARTVDIEEIGSLGNIRIRSQSFASSTILL
jgi:hypothetical protein